MQKIFEPIGQVLLSPLIVASSIFLFFQLQIFNVRLDFRDEGFLTYNALRILQGDIPYRDFFLTTTPGTYYIQSFLMQLFGTYLLVGRILYVVVVLAILYLVARSFDLSRWAKYIVLIILGLVFISPAYAFYNTEGLLLILISFFIVFRKNNTKRLWVYALAGAIAAFLFLIKQSYGVANISAVFVTLYLLNKNSNWYKACAVYIASISLILLLYAIYLAAHNALGDFIYYVFTFSREVKAHRAPFIMTSLLLIPMYVVAVNLFVKISLKKRIVLIIGFIALALGSYLILFPERLGRVLTVVTDPLVYYYIALLLIPLTTLSLLLRTKSKQSKEIVIVAVFSLLLFLASASSGRDYTTILIVSPFFISLCVLIFQSRFKTRMQPLIVISAVIIYMLPLLMGSGKIFHSAQKFESYVADVPEAYGIRIPSDQAIDLKEAISYIKTKVPHNEPILCFPYCPLLFVLAERDSASYFSFFYPETFRTSDQTHFLQDVRRSKPKLVILQKPGSIEYEALFEDERLTSILEHIHANYKLEKVTDNFSFYVPK